MEIVDPDSGEPLPHGQVGEIVVTTLWKEAMPFIRYRTGDMAMRLEYEECPCGRTFSRISRIKGRISHMVRVGEARIFPVDLEETIQAFPELTGEYQILLQKPGVQDTLEVSIECNPGVKEFDMLRKKLQTRLEESSGVKCKVNLVAYGTLHTGLALKAQRVVKAYEKERR